MSNQLIFEMYVFFAIYCAGSMVVLQLQHFALYPKVGREAFIDYIKANNRAAFVPAILPALLLLILNIILLFSRPGFLPTWVVITTCCLNIINIISSLALQAPFHANLERTGYNTKNISLLINSNWIRTTALLISSVLAIYAVRIGLQL